MVVVCSAAITLCYSHHTHVSNPSKRNNQNVRMINLPRPDETNFRQIGMFSGLYLYQCTYRMGMFVFESVSEMRTMIISGWYFSTNDKLTLTRRIIWNGFENSENTSEHGTLERITNLYATYENSNFYSQKNSTHVYG